jgi:hypothetical protein
MKWFRSNIRYGARLALLALSIQLVLSFGHFHVITPAQASIVSAHFENVSRDEHRSDRDSDRAADLCDICAVVAMAGMAMPALPLPPLSPPDAVNRLNWHADHYAAVVDIRRAPFQPRAPPIL